MLRIVRAELGYGFWFLFPLVGVPLVYLFELAEDEPSGFLVWLFAFLGVNGIITARSRENRSRLVATLPVPIWRLGVARLTLVLVPALVTLLGYATLHLFHSPGGTFEVDSVFVGFGLVVLCYSGTFMLKDRFPELMDRYRSSIVLALTVAVGMLAGAAVFVGMRADQPPRAFEELFRIVASFNPFGGPWGPARFLLVSLLVSTATVLTYRRRRSFVMENGSSGCW